MSTCTTCLGLSGLEPTWHSTRCQAKERRWCCGSARCVGVHVASNPSPLSPPSSLVHQFVGAPSQFYLFLSDYEGTDSEVVRSRSGCKACHPPFCELRPYNKETSASYMSHVVDASQKAWKTPSRTMMGGERVVMCRDPSHPLQGKEAKRVDRARVARHSHNCCYESIWGESMLCESAHNDHWASVSICLNVLQERLSWPCYVCACRRACLSVCQWTYLAATLDTRYVHVGGRLCKSWPRGSICHVTSSFWLWYRALPRHTINMSHLELDLVKCRVPSYTLRIWVTRVQAGCYHYCKDPPPPRQHHHEHHQQCHHEHHHRHHKDHHHHHEHRHSHHEQQHHDHKHHHHHYHEHHRHPNPVRLQQTPALKGPSLELSFTDTELMCYLRKTDHASGCIWQVRADNK